MPNYINGRICLTTEESTIFQERISHPDALTARRRDNFLRDISLDLRVTQADGGVYIEYSPEKQNPIFITSTYRTSTNSKNADAHGQYVKVNSSSVQFSSKIAGEKRQIRYGMARKNECTQLYLPLSA